MRADRLDRPRKLEAVLLLAQENRGHRAGRVVYRHDQIQIRSLAQPGVFRTILKQHHARQRTPLALASMHAPPRRLGRQPAQLQHALHQAVGPLERLAVRHRPAHDLLVEVLGREIEIPRSKHLRQPLRFRIGNSRRTHPTSPTVDQPLLATILIGVPQPTEMTLAQSQQLPSFHAAQSSRSMRPYRIQYTRHPNLRQHVISRSKNRTNHALPNPDISLATDTRSRRPWLSFKFVLASQSRPTL